MARASAEAIILRTRPVGEADLFVTFLTASEGKLTGAAKNARKSRRRFGGALEPLTRGRARWSENEAREIVRLESFEITVSFAERQAELAWFYLFAYLAEVADTFAREREPDARFYRLLRAATDASGSGAGPRAVRRWFEVWTLRLQGLLPGMDECARCGAPAQGEGVMFAAGTREVLCAKCAGSLAPGDKRVRLSSGERAWIRTALERPITAVSDPGRVPGIDRLFDHLFLEFTGRPFRSARFLETQQ